MIDWRYEGILSGYCSLFRNTGNHNWLNWAVQAAEDILASQLPDGRYRNSSFQQGPMEGGTPHEAAVDVGLLELSELLREIGDDHWQIYFEVAKRNLFQYLLERLWNGKGFRDQPWDPGLVSNKNATAVEALILYETLSGQDMSEYIDTAVQVILSSQVKNGPRIGGIVHAGTGIHQMAIGIYTARSMNGLLHVYGRNKKSEFLEIISRAMQFLAKLITPMGTNFGYYRKGQIIANPRWIAGSGDFLRLALLAEPYGIVPDGMVQQLINLLTKTQYPSGGIPTAFGLGHKGSSKFFQDLPEFRDVLPVVGWCDKAFRALSMLCNVVLEVNIEDHEKECKWKGERCIFNETTKEFVLRKTTNAFPIYCWKKGDSYPSVYHL